MNLALRHIGLSGISLIFAVSWGCSGHTGMERVRAIVTSEPAVSQRVSMPLPIEEVSPPVSLRRTVSSNEDEPPTLQKPIVSIPFPNLHEARKNEALKQSTDLFQEPTSEKADIPLKPNNSSDLPKIVQEEPQIPNETPQNSRAGVEDWIVEPSPDLRIAQEGNEPSVLESQLDVSRDLEEGSMLGVEGKSDLSNKMEEEASFLGPERGDGLSEKKQSQKEIVQIPLPLNPVPLRLDQEPVEMKDVVEPVLSEKTDLLIESPSKAVQEFQNKDSKVDPPRAELKALIEDKAPPLLPYLEEKTTSIGKLLNVQEAKKMPVPDLQIEPSKSLREKGMAQRTIVKSEVSPSAVIPDKKKQLVMQESQQRTITNPSSLKKPQKRIGRKKTSPNIPRLSLRLVACDEGRAQLIRQQYQDALSAFSQSIQEFSVTALRDEEVLELKDCYRKRAHVFLQLNQPVQALDDINSVLKDTFLLDEGNLSKDFFFRGRIFFVLKVFQSTIDDISQALDIGLGTKDEAYAYYLRGVSYLQLQQIDLGLNDLGRACRAEFSKACELLEQIL